MADLRRLLNTENADYLQRQARATYINPSSNTDTPESTTWGTGWGPILEDGYTQYFVGHCNNANCTMSYWDYCGGWCAPPGVTQITFEIWGGGGSGAGACCCQQGSPGGAGAYSRRTLCGCDFPGQSLGGFCYLWFLAPPTCCSSCCVGLRGCKTWITGCGLSNFCADGGLPGKTCCFVYYCFNGNGSQPTFGPSCTSFAAGAGAGLGGPGCYTFPPDGFVACDCACGYGGDYAIGGKLGWFRVDCACGDTCWVKLGIPQPGGTRDQCTRYFITKNWGNSCINDIAYCVTGEWPSTSCCGWSMHGQGSPSATSCGGPCCYGWRGSRGLIRITYK